MILRPSGLLFVAFILCAQQSPIKRPHSEVQSSSNAAENKTGNAPKPSVSPGASPSGSVEKPASHTKTNDANQRGDSFEKFLQNLKKQFENFKPLSDILSAWALVLVGCGGVYAAIRTLRAIEGQGSTTWRSLVLTQRPRLIVRRIILDKPEQAKRFLRSRMGEATFEADAPIEGYLSLVNSGNGIATVAESECAVIKSGPPDQLPRRFQQHQGVAVPLVAVGTSLQPGQTIECRFYGSGPSSEQYTQAEAAGAGIQFYVTGWIDYRDELGLMRRIGFCRQYIPELDRFFPVDDADYEYAD